MEDLCQFILDAAWDRPLTLTPVFATSTNRVRLVLEVAELTRRLWPAFKPVFCRLSITDWHFDGERNTQGEWTSWGIEQSQMLVSELDKIGIDLIDCTSGGLDLDQTVRAAHGYNVRMAAQMDPDRLEADFSTTEL